MMLLRVGGAYGVRPLPGSPSFYEPDVALDQKTCVSRPLRLANPRHCACARRVIHLMRRTLPKSEPKKRRAAPFSSPAGSGGLVRVPGLCHVPHRTALLSQFGGQ
jgi:hypothetical protein